MRAWGQGSSWQLGLGCPDDFASPQTVTALEKGVGPLVSRGGTCNDRSTCNSAATPHLKREVDGEIAPPVGTAAVTAVGAVVEGAGEIRCIHLFTSHVDAFAPVSKQLLRHSIQLPENC